MKRKCMMMEETAIKVVWKKMEDLEEGSSRGRKLRQNLGWWWRSCERGWKGSGRSQRGGWEEMTELVEQIAEDVRELFDGLVLVLEDKGKEKESEGMEVEKETEDEIGVETQRDVDGDLEMEETLKESEKLVDEADRVERDVIEE